MEKARRLSSRGERRAALDDLLSQKKEQGRREIGQRRRYLTVVSDDDDDDDEIEEEEDPQEDPVLLGEAEEQKEEHIIEDNGPYRRKTKRKSNERRMSGEYFVKYVDTYRPGEVYDGGSSSDLDDFIASSEDAEEYPSTSSSSEEEENEEEKGDVRMNRMEQEEELVDHQVRRKRQRNILVSSSSSDDDYNDVPSPHTTEIEQQQEEEECEIVVEPQRMPGGDEKQKSSKIVVRKNHHHHHHHHEGGPTLRERKGPSALSPLERIRHAQKKVIEVIDLEDSVIDPDESCSLLTDEGEPSSSNATGAMSDQDPSEEVPVAPSPHDTIWRQEAEKLGINKMSEEEAFKAYIEYLFICSIDPEYEEQVKQSSSHRLLYTQAIRRIEYLIIQAQDYVHSESWRCCDTFLLESMERHAFIERVTPDQPYHHKEDDCCEECLNTCAACGKGNGWIQVEFKCETSAKHSTLAGERDADMMLSQQYALASPIYQRNRRFVGREREGSIDYPQESKCFFWLGNTCVKRISIFHALFHFRQHCVAFLKRIALRELKTSIEAGKPMSIDDMMDVVLSDHNHSRMYACFTSLLRVAESYQIASGSEKFLLGKKIPHCDPPQYTLLSGKFTDIDVAELDTYLKDA